MQDDPLPISLTEETVPVTPAATAVGIDHVWKLLPDFLQHIETVQIYIMHGHDLSLP